MRYLLTLLILVLAPLTVKADIIPTTIYAVTPTEINNLSTVSGDTISLYAIVDEKKKPDENINLKNADRLEVKIKEYIFAKRGKRDGYYKVEYNHNGKTFEGKMKIATPKDIKSIAQSAGISIAGKILKVPGFSQAFALSKGLIAPNENESRLKSAGKNLYESTPLTYVEKGKDFSIEEDGVVVLKLKEKEVEKEIGKE